MRIALFAIPALALLAACGGPQDSQANNVQTNMDGSAVPPATAAATALPAQPPATKDAALQVMHDRHEAMEGLGKASKAVKRELDSGAPDLAAIRKAAAAYTDAAPKIANMFPPGTGPDVGKTRAKPEIWQNSQDFAAKIDAFQHSATAFATAAAGTDVAAIKTGFADLGGTCKACHDKYRAEEKR
jgi:cytochrome c556